jgi:hypothetical protein
LWGRSRTVVVDRDNYLAQELRYIHLNPLEAGLVREVESYVCDLPKPNDGAVFPLPV